MGKVGLDLAETQSIRTLVDAIDLTNNLYYRILQFSALDHLRSQIVQPDFYSLFHKLYNLLGLPVFEASYLALVLYYIHGCISRNSRTAKADLTGLRSKQHCDLERSCHQGHIH